VRAIVVGLVEDKVLDQRDEELSDIRTIQRP
jgi:hypothetical protein